MTTHIFTEQGWIPQKHETEWEKPRGASNLYKSLLGTG